MRPNANPRIATRRDTTRGTWVQLSIGAGVLLLPPLALGAAFYAMLAPPAVDDTAAVQVPPAAPDLHPPAAPIAAPVANVAPPAIAEAPPSKPAADDSEGDRPAAKGGPVQLAVTPAAVSGGAVTPATARSGASAAVTLAPDTPAAPKRPLHRHPPRPQPDAFTLKGWLQDIGILARDGNSATADGHRQ